MAKTPSLPPLQPPLPLPPLPGKPKKRALKTAEDAVQVADTYAEKYYPFRQLRTAKREGLYWIVELDVGALKPLILRFRLSRETGKILEITSGNPS